MAIKNGITLKNNDTYLIAYDNGRYAALAKETLDHKWFFDSFDFVVGIDKVTVLAHVNFGGLGPLDGPTLEFA